MQTKAFRVRKFRNIDDSGKIELGGPLTCVVGKNQSGKSALLRALHKFNPHRSEPYDMRKEWPRGHRTERRDDQVVCEVHFALTSEEAQNLNKIAGLDAIAPQQTVVVARNYAGTYEIGFPENPEHFPNPLNPDAIASICEGLPKPIRSLGMGLFQAASNCSEETKRCITEGTIEKLAGLRERHKSELEAEVNADETNPQTVKQRQFIGDYLSSIEQIKAQLDEQLNRYQQAHDFIVKSLPTFIYMEDYKTFRGRADLAGLRDRRNSQSGDLSEEDETILMILKLAGLDLDELIDQGLSDEQDVLHDRQLDLQDAAKTLTKQVAGRWGQNQYEIQFRVDGQTFFTEIEEAKKRIGMIPLEEQSKGFQWFFSFDLHFMHDSDGTFEGCVLLLDEPGLHLHPGGQEDLLKRLDAYSKKNTLIYTTHLPFLVDLRDPWRIRVINQTDSGAVVSDDLGQSQEDERLTLQAAFGMRANQSYLVSHRNLLVEGASDYWIIAELSRILECEGRACLPSDVLITAAGNASAIVPVATIMIGQNLDVVALFDSDTEGKRAKEKLLKKWITRYKAGRASTLLVGDTLGGADMEATIEDLFPEDYYMHKVDKSHGQKLNEKGLKFDALEISESGSIVRRLNQSFRKAGIKFNKGSVAKLIRHDLVRASKLKELPEGLEERAERLMTALRHAFGTMDDTAS